MDSPSPKHVPQDNTQPRAQSLAPRLHSAPLVTYTGHPNKLPASKHGQHHEKGGQLPKDISTSDKIANSVREDAKRLSHQPEESIDPPPGNGRKRPRQNSGSTYNEDGNPEQYPNKRSKVASSSERSGSSVGLHSHSGLAHMPRSQHSTREPATGSLPSPSKDDHYEGINTAKDRVKSPRPTAPQPASTRPPPAPEGLYPEFLANLYVGESAEPMPEYLSTADKMDVLDYDIAMAKNIKAHFKAMGYIKTQEFLVEGKLLLYKKQRLLLGLKVEKEAREEATEE
jgi:hypothetical protein